MHSTCIAVVDATRARLFTLDRISDAEGLREELTEQRDLVNPARRKRPSELFSDTRPGTTRSGNVSHTVDDHRGAHIDELDIEFSRAIMDELSQLAQSSHAQRIVLCASPRMLGRLRELSPELKLPIDELPRDLVKLTPSQLREHLASNGILPAEPARPEGRA